MQHVIFARDRKRKKHRFKVFILLLAILSIAIGIVMSLQKQEVPTSDLGLSNLSQNQQQSTTAKEGDLEIAQAEEEGIVIELAGEPEEIKESDLHHGEPTYIDIDILEAEEEEAIANAEEDDGSATSYDDELQAKDDEDTEQATDEMAQTDGQAEVDKSVQELAADQKKEEAQVELSQEAQNVLDDFLDVADQAIRIQNQFSYSVRKGDKLKDVLEQSGTSSAMARALEKRFPQLANLQAGQQFYWVLDKDGQLEYMNWLVSEKEEKIFERKGKNQFAVKTIQKKGKWQQDVVKGGFNGDFSSSLKGVGLSQRQINQLASGLQWQISTNKLKKGDRFAILVRREYINGKVTELGNVEAIHVLSGGKSYYAIQADNGRYYSRHGETLGKGFARYPLQFTPRISSHFNPRRIHPITRRVRPHKGVDFAIPVGTPIIAPADGVVEHVAYQAKGAGRYIRLRHGGQYTTVYMHLSRQLVKVGQRVKKGDRIALSGNTGGSTGAHLHYEFYINGHVVNPMTVKLPGTGSGMPENERKAFLAKSKNVVAKLKL